MITAECPQTCSKKQGICHKTLTKTIRNEPCTLCIDCRSSTNNVNYNVKDINPVPKRICPPCPKAGENECYGSVSIVGRLLEPTKCVPCEPILSGSACVSLDNSL